MLELAGRGALRATPASVSPPAPSGRGNFSGDTHDSDAPRDKRQHAPPPPPRGQGPRSAAEGPLAHTGSPRTVRRFTNSPVWDHDQAIVWDHDHDEGSESERSQASRKPQWAGAGMLKWGSQSGLDEGGKRSSGAAEAGTAAPGAAAAETRAALAALTAPAEGAPTGSSPERSIGEVDAVLLSSPMRTADDILAKRRDELARARAPTWLR
jgi:hypothetical protein